MAVRVDKYNDFTPHNGLPATVLTVKDGYGDDFGKRARMLCFQTESAPASMIAPLCRLIDSYNEYDGQAVGAVVEAIGALWAEYEITVNFRYGREGSPVLYVDFPDLPETPIKARLIARTKELLQGAKPDELFPYPYPATEDQNLRAWWD